MKNNNHEQLLSPLIPERENKIARGKMIKVEANIPVMKIVRRFPLFPIYMKMT